MSLVRTNKVQAIGNRITIKGDEIALEGNVVWSTDQTGTPAWVDPQYFGTIGTYSAIEAALNYISSNVRTLYLSPGEWIIDDDLTILKNVNFYPDKGAVLVISSGKTLKIDGPISAGAYQIFGGTGDVDFSDNHSMPFFLMEWWGTIADGLTDNTDAINRGFTATRTGGGGPALFSAGSYVINDVVEIPAGLSIYGAGVDNTIFDCLGSSTPFIGTERWYHQKFEAFTITHENNTSGVDIAMVDARIGSNNVYYDFKLIAKYGITKDGLIIRSINPDTGLANTTPAHNEINLRTTKSETNRSTGIGVWLYGQDTPIANRCNANIVRGVVDGFETAVWCNGAENKFFHGVNTATWGLHLYGNGTVRNWVMANLDGGGDTCPIKLESTAAGRIHMATIIESVDTAANITAVGTSYTPAYTWIWKTIYVGSTKTAVDFDDIDSPVIPGYAADSVMMLWGDRTEESNCGRVIVAGAEYAGSTGAVSNYGGVSISIRNHADAEFRVVKKTDGVASFSKLFAITSSGAIQDLITSNGPVGTVTLATTGGQTVVNNTGVTAASLIYLFPTSLTAARNTSGTYISAKSAGATFTITHVNPPPAGCTYNYLILN